MGLLFLVTALIDRHCRFNSDVQSCFKTILSVYYAASSFVASTSIDQHLISLHLISDVNHRVVNSATSHVFWEWSNALCVCSFSGKDIGILPSLLATERGVCERGAALPAHTFTAVLLSLYSRCSKRMKEKRQRSVPWMCLRISASPWLIGA